MMRDKKLTAAVRASALGSGKHPPLADAPGTYVMEK